MNRNDAPPQILYINVEAISVRDDKEDHPCQIHEPERIGPEVCDCSTNWFLSLTHLDNSKEGFPDLSKHEWTVQCSASKSTTPIPDDGDEVENEPRPELQKDLGKPTIPPPPPPSPTENQPFSLNTQETFGRINSDRSIKEVHLLGGLESLMASFEDE